MGSDVAEKFLSLANAYLTGAEALAHTVEPEGMIPEYTASVCMFNARLSVELFLKGMIARREPGGKVATHRLEDLRNEFRRLYSGQEFEWNVPFTIQVIGGSEKERAEVVRENLKNRPLDQIFRYPLDNKGCPWEMVGSVSNLWFQELTNQIRLDMKRLLRSAEGGA